MNEQVLQTQLIRMGSLLVEPARRVCRGPKGLIQLTAAQFETLLLLMKAYPNPVLAVDIILSALRRPMFGPLDRSATQLILQLRRRLPKDEDGLDYIVTIRNAGYLLRAPVYTYTERETPCHLH